MVITFYMSLIHHIECDDVTAPELCFLHKHDFSYVMLCDFLPTLQMFHQQMQKIMRLCEAQRSQNTLESLSDETFWFKLKDVTTYGHLKMEIYTVGNWIPKFWEDEKSSVPQIEQIVFEERFFMENEVLCAHIQHEAFKVTDLIRRECESRKKPARQKKNEKPAKLRQRTTSCPF